MNRLLAPHRANLLTGGAGNPLTLMAPSFVASSGAPSTYVSTSQSAPPGASFGTHLQRQEIVHG